MGRIIEEYKRFKEIDPNKIILFESGVFYNAIEDDAKYLNEKLGLQITKNDIGGYIRCGFPVRSLSTYIEKLKVNDIEYQIVNSVPKKESKSTIKERIIREILKMDLDNMTPLEAHAKLLEFQNKIK